MAELVKKVVCECCGTQVMAEIMQESGKMYIFIKHRAHGTVHCVKILLN